MERSTQVAAVNPAAPPDAAALLATLRSLQQQVAAVGWPRRSDLVGRELGTIDRALRRLLRELGERDSVDD